MFTIYILNLKNNERFKKVFWGIKSKNDFIRKCKFSNNLKIIGIDDYSYLFD